MNNTTQSNQENISTGVLVYSVILFVIVVLALAGNAIVCLAFYRSSTFRSATVLFILSLAVTDILVATISIPLWLSLQLKFCEDQHCLTPWKITDVLFSTASIMNLCAISVDRLVIISRPLHYPNIMTTSRANIALVAIWGFAVTLSALISTSWSFYPTFVFIVAFVLPLLIMISSYSFILKAALSQVRRVFPIRQAYYFKRELKAAKTLGIVMGAFITCWAPFFLVNLIVSYRKDIVVSTTSIAGIKTLHYINSALNPVIYSCSNKEFRFKILRVLPCGSARHSNMIDRVVFWSTTLGASTDLSSTYRDSFRAHKN
ncbi:dopamine receptor 2-like [Exaiptasia diaphana]|uniref:G-protein coupled receptors family 1 profile domain-containing protein n=1 Tax=Exaiptasia diaphana TaxID=2652724 RepID=A0A913X5P1_EXADI|nr:dopamine receptor 2-like [Exaiptasia diaphana]